MAELHARTHQRQDTHVWVDQRSQQTHETYQKVFEERRRTLEQGESSERRPDTSDDYATWEQVAGGRKKNRVYGMGALAGCSPSSYSSCSVDSVRPPTDSAIQQKLDLLLSAFNAHKEQVDAHNRAVEERYTAQQAQIALLQSQLQERGSASTGPSEPVIEAEEQSSTESDRAE